MTLHELNGLPPAEAKRVMLEVCGSGTWARKMVAARPFATVTDVLKCAEQFWAQSTQRDWMEAFAAHPRIGENSASHYSQREQQMTQEESIKLALSEGNAEYEKKNGFIFIVFASGKTPEQMLAILQARLRNERHVEMRTAAAEQWKIVKLRLERLLNVDR